MSLTDFRTLGRSGLVVGPAALGTMTFGKAGWGTSDADSKAVFDAYVDAGGIVIDTADVYSAGRSEELVGAFVADRGLRDRLVLATKFGFNAENGNPLSGGNGAKNIHRALHGSLRRLRTDYVDLYWMHAFDTVTPVEEVLHTLGNLQRAGKIRHFGFSNVPAWYVARAATLAAAHGSPAPVALQLQYSLVERSIEREHVPAARECGLSIMSWSPLAGGFLTGKYDRDGSGPDRGGRDGADGAGQGRLAGPNPFSGTYTKFTERNWQVLDALRAVAAAVERTPAQVALAWAAEQPGMTALVLGATAPQQLHDNLSALDLHLTAEQRQALDAASVPEPVFPYPLFEPGANRTVFGGVAVRGWSGA